MENVVGNRHKLHPCIKHERYRGSSQIKFSDGDPDSSRPWKTTNQVGIGSCKWSNLCLNTSQRPTLAVVTGLTSACLHSTGTRLQFAFGSATASTACAAHIVSCHAMQRARTLICLGHCCSGLYLEVHIQHSKSQISHADPRCLYRQRLPL